MLAEWSFLLVLNKKKTVKKKKKTLLTTLNKVQYNKIFKIHMKLWWRYLTQYTIQHHTKSDRRGHTHALSCLTPLSLTTRIHRARTPEYYYTTTAVTTAIYIRRPWWFLHVMIHFGPERVFSTDIDRINSRPQKTRKKIFIGNLKEGKY